MSTETKHTAEPWKTGARYPGRVIAGSSVIYCTNPQDEGSETEDEKSKAARIVACVNACAGIKDPAAALAMAKGLLRRVREHVASRVYTIPGGDELDEALSALG